MSRLRLSLLLIALVIGCIGGSAGRRRPQRSVRCPASNRLVVSRIAPDQGQLHDLLGGAVYLPRPGRLVLPPDEARAVLCKRGGSEEGRMPEVEAVREGTNVSG